MGCSHSKVVSSTSDDHHQGGMIGDDGLPCSPMDAISLKRSDDVEEFFKKAYQYGSHVEVLKEFMSHDAARLKLLEYLEIDYFANSPEAFQVMAHSASCECWRRFLNIVALLLSYVSQEAMEFLQFEVEGVSLDDPSNKTDFGGIRKLSPREFAKHKLGWSHDKRKRYKEVITEIGTVAFKRFLKSRMYLNFRSFERGALSSLRADVMRRLPSIEYSMDESIFSNHVQSQATVATQSIMPPEARSRDTSLKKGSSSLHNNVSTETASYSFHNRRNPSSMDNNSSSEVIGYSFTKRAFNSVGIHMKDKALLHGSTWLALLIGGVESCPLGFCIIAADREGFPIVGVNSYLERTLGRDRSTLVGSGYEIVTGSDLSIFTRDMAGQMEQFHRAVKKGSNVIVEIATKNSQDEYSECIVGLRPVYDQHKTYRYMIMLVFNQKDRCTAVPGENGEESPGYEEEYRMVALCHVHYLLDLISLIPSSFLDEDV
jgi:hypothetical protein